MKVAFATGDRQRIDAHFGWAPYIDIYDVTPLHSALLATHAFGALEEDGDEDKLGPKLAAIADCAIVYVAAIGGSAAARVVAQRVHPVKVPQPEPIPQAIARLQTVLQGTPPPWLRKALRKGGEIPAEFGEDGDA